MSRRAFFFLLIIVCVLTMFAAVIATPTLSFDDLLIAKEVPLFLTSDGWVKTAWRFLSMSDVGQTELRTYGLTRVIQLVTVSWFGASPALTMAFVITAHSASGLLVYRLLTRAIGDKVSSALLAIAWVTSPAIIPTIRTEHHWLYLITPYYAIIGWVVLQDTGLRSARRFCAGSVLLTSAWYLGEAPTLPLVLVCVLWVLTARHWKSAIYIGGQAAISLTLLGAYIAYQLTFINHPNEPHRFTLKGFSFRAFGYFFQQLWENVKGIVGLQYREADLGRQISSLHVSDRWEVWALFAILLATWFSAKQIATTARSKVQPSMPLIGSIWMMWIGSLGVYFLLTLFQATAFPIRYTTAFFLFTPIALTLGVSALSRDLLFTRSAAAVAACFAVAFSTVLALRYEYTINQPNHILLAKMKGLGLIVYYPKEPGFVKGEVPGGTYLGVIPITSPGNGDPKKSFWTLSPMLDLYADAAVGSECRFTRDGKVELRQGPNVIGVRPQDKVVIVGTEKSLAQICDPQ